MRPSREKSMHEQHAMLYTLGNIGSHTSHKWLARGMQLVKLDEVGFPTGKVWFDGWNSPKFETDKLRAFILHCNWVTAASSKKQRLKRENLWFLDDNDSMCQANMDPFHDKCQRRCLPVNWCKVGGQCEMYDCRAFTRRALTDLARSIRYSVGGTEDRWHPMAWQRACGSPGSVAAPSGQNSAMSAAAATALDRATILLRNRASATAIFSDPNLTDIKGHRSFGDVREKLGHTQIRV